MVSLPGTYRLTIRLPTVDSECSIPQTSTPLLHTLIPLSSPPLVSLCGLQRQTLDLMQFLSFASRDVSQDVLAVSRKIFSSSKFLTDLTVHTFLPTFRPIQGLLQDCVCAPSGSRLCVHAHMCSVRIVRARNTHDSVEGLE